MVETVALDRGLAKTVAPNGLTVLSEHLPGVRSAAIGIWVRTASAHEPRPLMGVSHLLEHMVFKGTERRTARQLALELEVRGGALDAFTSRDHTAFQAHVLDEDLPRAIDVLTDLVRRPLLRESDLDLERNVVLEEISTVDDTPDDLVFEVFGETLFPEHPYGYSILGTRDTVSALERRRPPVGARRRLLPRQLRGGGGGPGRITSRSSTCSSGKGGSRANRPRRPAPRSVPARRSAAGRCGSHGTPPRPTSRSVPTPSRTRIPAASPSPIVTNLFGGGMSSRLFQRVREELGLAYGVYAYHQLYQSAGVAGVYVGTKPASADQAMEAIRAEYRRLAGEGLTADELAEGKQQLKGQVMLSLESPASRMSRMAGITLFEDRYRPLDAVLAEIDAVTVDEAAAVSAEFFDPDRQTVVRLGPK